MRNGLTACYFTIFYNLGITLLIQLQRDSCPAQAYVVIAQAYVVIPQAVVVIALAYVVIAHAYVVIAQAIPN